MVGVNAPIAKHLEICMKVLKCVPFKEGHIKSVYVIDKFLKIF